MVIKNYKKLCELLEEEIQAGNTKKAQEKNWQRYFNYEKEGQKYIITRIYNKPLPKIDNRTLGNNSEYVEHIKFILLHYLSKQEGYTARITLRKLFLLLGMINDNYYNTDKKDLIDEGEHITDYQVNHFYQRTYKKLKDTIFSSLRSLKNSCLILYEEIIMISIYEDNLKVIREATDKEKEYILIIQKEVLKEMELESIILVHLKFKQKEFYNRVNYLLMERYNINYSYTDIKIIYNQKNIIEAKEQAEILMQKKMLNDKFISSVNNQAVKILEKNNKDYEDQIYKDIIGEPSPFNKKKYFKLDEEVYLYAQQKLAEMLLKY